jgi:hypothetical protein
MMTNLTSTGQKTAIDVARYQTNPIDVKGAFASDFDVQPHIKLRALNTLAEVHRPHFVDQPRVRYKHWPLRHDPATGAISTAVALPNTLGSGSIERCTRCKEVLICSHS